MTLTFTVYGEPRPQGSKRGFWNAKLQRVMIVEDNKNTKPWRQMVAETAMAEVAKQGWKKSMRPTPIYARFCFYFDKPVSARKMEVLKTTKPDNDKLLRAMLDALEGVVYEHDAQVAAAFVLRPFGSPARVVVEIEELPLFVKPAAPESLELFAEMVAR